MSFLNRNTITIEARLTEKGREYLANGSPLGRAVKFALADTPVDYRLWDPNHANGSDYYGEAIENMPILQSDTGGRVMQLKLITLPKNTLVLPQISLPATSYVLPSNTAQPTILSPITLNIPNANQTEGYTATLSNTDVATMKASGPASIGKSSSQVGKTLTLIGNTFELRAIPQTASDKTCTVTIVGNETGGEIVVTLRVIKLPNILSNNFGISTSALNLPTNTILGGSGAPGTEGL